MRALWIALLIALLPLRGWVGDAMAVAMIPAPAQHSAPTAQAGDTDCPHAAPAVQPVAAAVDATASHTDHTAHGDASAHLLCDVCNGPVLGTAAAPAAAVADGHGPHIERKQAFASLAPRHVVKPPIA
jgi:hypothetical protein